MKTKNYYLILAIVTGILCVPALGEEGLLLPIEPGLIGQANPGLAGIDKLYVGIAIGKWYVGVTPDIDPNKDGLAWEELETKVMHSLREAGIRVVGNIKTVITVGLNISELSELRVDIDMLKLDGSQKYVFCVQASLARMVNLPKHRFYIKADVWKTEPTMHAVSVHAMPDTVTNVVLEHIEAFIHAYFAANRPVKLSDTKRSETVSQTAQTQQPEPAAKPAVAKYNYVASKNSKVFHKPQCSSAKRILPKNLVAYNSRGEALKAGRRPCKICKP